MHEHRQTTRARVRREAWSRIHQQAISVSAEWCEAAGDDPELLRLYRETRRRILAYLEDRAEGHQPSPPGGVGRREVTP